MRAFTLDPHLARDCLRLGRLELCELLLMNNADVPWFVLVPATDVDELCDLDPATHARLFEEVNAVARFVRGHFTVDKLNVASIGNVVRQLHVHVVGRSVDDYCWPGVVWGTTREARYPAAHVAALVDTLAASLGGAFSPHDDG